MFYSGMFGNLSPWAGANPENVNRNPGNFNNYLFPSLVSASYKAVHDKERSEW